MASNTTILITGANRGIGRGLAATYLQRDNTTVIAAVRSPDKDTSKSPATLPNGKDSKLILVKIDSLVDTDAQAAVETLRSRDGVTKLDMVIASAGEARYMGPVYKTPVEEMRYHYNLNAIGPFLLFQATWPLLQESASLKFVAISSRLGSIADMGKYKLPTGPYGASKAALNWFTCKAQHENPTLTAIVVCPGWTQTDDLGNKGAVMAGMTEAPIPLAKSLEGVIKEIDEAVRDEDMKFGSWDHIPVAW